MEKLILSGCLVVNKNKEILLLYKTNHKHFETPGGKIKTDECTNPKRPSIEELKKTAERETYEELGNKIKLEELNYFGKIEFTIPDGRKAIAHKFLTNIISGEPTLNEPETFNKIKWIPIKDLEKFKISPDLKLLCDKLKSISHHKQHP